MNNIIKLYVTLVPTIISGILNMIWCKVPICKALNVPIDNNKLFFDKKRVFGDNKTWKGFVGYIVLAIITSIVWGGICKASNLNTYNFFYFSHENNLTNNIIIGFLLGLFYAIFELPNSFLKRRLDIEPGKTTKGFKKLFFIVLDQADSLFGVCLVVAMYYKISFGVYCLYVLVGAVTHLLINVLLYCFKLRKNMF